MVLIVFNDYFKFILDMSNPSYDQDIDQLLSLNSEGYFNINYLRYQSI